MSETISDMPSEGCTFDMSLVLVWVAHSVTNRFCLPIHALSIELHCKRLYDAEAGHSGSWHTSGGNVQ
jgi:hypothetical protein